MSDLIRRQDVLSVLCFSNETGMMLCEDLRNIFEEINKIPPAEPERKWIPFDVALPNDRQKVLCINKHDEMMVGGYLTDYGMTFPCYFEKPIAWMPLPEPWRGD